MIWSGSVRGSSGKWEPLYLKRARNGGSGENEPLNDPEANLDEDSQTNEDYHGVDYCGDGGCVPLQFQAVVRKTNLKAFRDLLDRLPVANDGVGCDEFEKTSENDSEICITGEAYPLREKEVVLALRTAEGVISAGRPGEGAGTDTESLFIKPGKFVSGKKK